MESGWKSNLIQSLLAVDAIREEVGWRIYSARLGSIKDPSFPCINFEIEGGSFPYRATRFSQFSMRFWFYTEESMEAANSLYALGDLVLRNSVTPGDAISVVLDPATSPVEIFEQKLFAITVSYWGRSIQ